jgi:hypothetical protein
MNNSVLIDIETLSRHSNAIVTEFTAIAFNRDTFQPVDEITLDPCIATQLAAGRHFEPDTISFHSKNDTLPENFTGTHPLQAAMTLGLWIQRMKPVKVWIWGKDFDRPILEDFFRDHRLPLPWEYWRTACARDVWNLAFPDKRPAKRPHSSREDAIASIADLHAALDAIMLTDKA